MGNALSVGSPTRDEPIRQRRRSGSFKQFLIAFVVSYLIGYLVNLILIWRVLAARALTERLGEAFIPGVLIVLSCLSYWVLLTVFAVALAQQPQGPPDPAEGDRRLQRERRGPGACRGAGGRCSDPGARADRADLDLMPSSPGRGRL